MGLVDRRNAPEPFLKVGGLSKSFGSTNALRDFDLEVNCNEIVTLLGPSGCGKTTALRIVAGLEGADSGKILLGGVPPGAPGHRNIAMVFQGLNLYPHKRIGQNLAYPLFIRRMSKEEIGIRVQEVSELLGISHLLSRYPHELSSGESQRAALAKALIRRPALLLLDEPFSNLDAHLRLRLRQDLRILLKQLEIAAVMVTHDQDEAMAVGDRIALMNAGQVLQVAPAGELYHRPQNTFVARFIGDPGINLLPVSRVADRLFPETRDANETTWSLPVPQTLVEILGDKVLLGIRPESLHLEPSAGPDQVRLTGRVHLVERLEPVSRVHLQVGATSVSLLNPEGRLLREGEFVALGFCLKDILLFGVGGTQERIFPP